MELALDSCVLWMSVCRSSALDRPAQPRIYIKSRRLQSGPSDWILYVCVCLCVRQRGARQVGVNPIRLAGFKRWRQGTPKLVTWAHPDCIMSQCIQLAFPHRSSCYSRLFTGFKSPSLIGPGCLSGLKPASNWISHRDQYPSFP